MKIAIIGLGLIGGSIAKDIKNKNLATKIIGLDRSRENINYALNQGIIDEVASSYYELSDSEYIILTVPVNVIKKDICDILDSMHPDTTLFDVASCKSEIAKATNGHIRRKNYVSCHPMSGTEFSGPENAMTNLFNGKVNIICDKELSGLVHLNKVQLILSELGMETVYMTSEVHDNYIAFISHLPHVLAFALANTIVNTKDFEKMLLLSGGGFKTSIRLAHSSASMWAPIFEQNKSATGKAIDLFIDELTKMKSSLSNCSDSEKLIKSANVVTIKLKEIENNKHKKKCYENN